jgi:hypothetical protein
VGYYSVTAPRSGLAVAAGALSSRYWERNARMDCCMDAHRSVFCPAPRAPHEKALLGLSEMRPRLLSFIGERDGPFDKLMTGVASKRCYAPDQHSRLSRFPRATAYVQASGACCLFPWAPGAAG